MVAAARARVGAAEMEAAQLQPALPWLPAGARAEEAEAGVAEEVAREAAAAELGVVGAAREVQAAGQAEEEELRVWAAQWAVVSSPAPDQMLGSLRG
jgi:hypothetical protein